MRQSQISLVELVALQVSILYQVSHCQRVLFCCFLAVVFGESLLQNLLFDELASSKQTNGNHDVSCKRACSGFVLFIEGGGFDREAASAVIYRSVLGDGFGVEGIGMCY